MEMHDAAALHASRNSLRQIWIAARNVLAHHDDPFLRGIAEAADRRCAELTAELEAIEPELPLAVRHPVLGMRIGGGMSGG